MTRLHRIGSHLGSTLSFSLLVLLLVATPAAATWVSLGGAEGSEVEVRVLESSHERVVVEMVVPGFEAEPVEISGSTYYRILLPGESNLLEAGLPDLPHVCRSILVSDDQRMAVRVLSEDVADLSGYPVAPSKGNLLRTVDPATVPYSFASAYESDEPFPAQAVRGGEPYIMRDFRGMVVEMLPLRAVTADGSLRATRRMVVEIAAEGPDVVNVIDRPAPPTSLVAGFHEVYRNHFINWDFQGNYAPLDERGPMLIISYDAFTASMAPFVEWKNQSGLPARIVDVSTIGNTATAIAAYIASAYQTEGIAFVLLVGDATQIASPSANGGSSDPSYSLVAGADNYPDLFVGRFSAENVGHVDTQVLRSVTYEQTPMPDGAWYHKGTGIASNQGPGDDNEYDNVHVGNIRTKLLNYTYTEVDEIYDPTANASMVTAALNNGRSIINYCGHGSQTSWGTTGFSNSHVAALQNDWMLPFIFSVACVNGQFSGGTCFAEAWLRSTRGANPIGAVATYMSSVNQSWNPPMCAEDECDDLLVHDEMHTFGGLCFNGSSQMMDEYGASGVAEFKNWHIFGDPSLLVRTATPEAMSVVHDGALLIGMDTYAVSVAGVNGALCALYGNGVLYGSAYTVAGAATIQMENPPAEPMELTLTVTGYNKVTVIDPVQVLPPSGPYLVVSANTVLDGAGDADGCGDAGETVGVDVVLTNVGVAPATSVEATIASEDSWVTIVTDHAAYGDIDAGQDGSCLAPFAVAVDPNAPDGHVVSFDVAVTAAEGAWGGSFTMPLHAPVLGAGAVLVDDSDPYGNGNGVAEPGETFYVQMWMPNSGHADVWSLAGIMSSLHQAVTVLDAEGECVRAPAGGVGLLGSYQVQLAPDCPNPAVLPLHVELENAAGFTATLNYEISVGSWVDNAESDRGWTLGVQGDTATSGTWVRAEPVGTEYNGQPAQTEYDHTPDPSVICFVTGNGSVGGAAGEADVDGGKTTLMTPVFDLSDAVSATVGYWRWYTNSLGNNPAQDYWDVDVTSDGTNWMHLEHTTASANSWSYQTFVVQEFVALTDQVCFRFVAEDQSPGSLVEGAVDDFVLDAQKTPATDVQQSTIVAESGLAGCRPNPLRSEGVIRYRLAGAMQARLALYDVAGRLVSVLAEGQASAGEHAVSLSGSGLESGIYFLRLETDDVIQVRQIAVVR